MYQYNYFTLSAQKMTRFTKIHIIQYQHYIGCLSQLASCDQITVILRHSWSQGRRNRGPFLDIWATEISLVVWIQAIYCIYIWVAQISRKCRIVGTIGVLAHGFHPHKMYLTQKMPCWLQLQNETRKVTEMISQSTITLIWMVDAQKPQ